MSEDRPVFDMQQLDAVGIFLHVFHRIILSDHRPVNIHFKKDQGRISAFQEQVVDNVAFIVAAEHSLFSTGHHLCKFKIMVMVTKRNACRLYDLSGFVEDIAYIGYFFHAAGAGLSRLHEILHTQFGMVVGRFLPEFHNRLAVLRGICACGRINMRAGDLQSVVLSYLFEFHHVHTADLPVVISGKFER